MKIKLKLKSGLELAGAARQFIEGEWQDKLSACCVEGRQAGSLSYPKT